MMTFLGGKAGDPRLNFSVLGGVYMAGGVALHLIDVPEEPSFMRDSPKKTCVQDFMRCIPIDVMSVGALVGVAIHGLETIEGTEGLA